MNSDNPAHVLQAQAMMRYVYDASSSQAESTRNDQTNNKDKSTLSPTEDPGEETQENRLFQSREIMNSDNPAHVLQAQAMMRYVYDASSSQAESTRNDQRANLIVADYNRLYLINLNETTVTKLVVGLQIGGQDTVKVDYHQTKSYIYWLDSYYGYIHRTCYPCYKDERKVDEIIPRSSSLYHPFSLAIDSDRDHIYWSDSSHNAILRSELDGSNITYVLNRTVGIGNIALDTTSSRIYFMDDGIGSIDRCTLDGQDQTTIISDSMLTRKSRIVLDFRSRRIFWTVGNTVRSATFEGMEFNEFQAYGSQYSWSRVIGIDVHADDLYYTNTIRYDMYKVNKSGENSVRAARVYNHMREIRTYDGKIITDSCDAFKSLNNAEKRSTGFYVDWTSDDPLTDETLEEDWYRVMSDNGDEMAISPPGMKFCGTTNPIWLNGTLPSFEDGNKSVIACMQTHNSVCEQTLDIVIRNCDGYYVYFLPPTPPDSSYCFGSGPVKCPTDMSSETEHYPGCSSNFPTDTMSVEVKAVLTEGESFKIGNYDPTPSLIPIFKCEFEDISNGTYGYDVYWYICANEVKNSTNLLFKDIDEAVVLRETDWIGKYRMNMQIRCKVRMRNSRQSTPGPYLDSPIFRAGLFKYPVL
ncbi:uncharacterized protein LOC134722722 [Mytilus trossulus]|uniref:uncharacterized protein LOC134722722 n=1 Tax=Mytilus trossulus TaxID=6551 RepID=UPI0030049C50